MTALAILIVASGLLEPQQTNPAASQPVAGEVQPTSQPTSTDSTARTPEQTGVLKELLRSVDRPATTTPEPIRSSVPSPVGRRDPSIRDEGTVLVERAGRLIRTGERSEFKFSSAEPGDTAQALELLPNSWLEYLEREAESGTHDFVITAEVTRYRGRNYLLLRNYRRQVQHGNLAP